MNMQFKLMTFHDMPLLVTWLYSNMANEFEDT